MNEIIEGVKVTSVDEWLKILFSKDSTRLLPNCCFPSEEIENEFLSTIHTRSDEEIRKVLRKFLVHNCSYGADSYTLKWLKEYPENINKSPNKEFIRRLFTRKEPWEGITWIIDLIPHSPKEALNTLSSYFYVHCQLLPDDPLVGLSDAMEIIRTKYIEYPHPKEILLDLTALDFEILISELFKQLEYDVELTKRSYDDGIDILCNKTEKSKKETLLIQCKRYTKNIGVKDIREFYGVIMDKKATKGIFCTTSLYSKSAKDFAFLNPSIELLNYKDIIQLLNESFGSNWPNRLEQIIIPNKYDYNKKAKNST